ncbi:V-set and immunoglobulin domain-containing protein 1-like [Anguilla anguilla]|uniref:V-set and immunoglobulin domain-containing protein 1-like n=1 Tax=Anguilla anguilla TaxID=7936 RepID=UPI0015ABA074|nr:V-set and immunoglobulin domain-containing protein 1-like [Anguilla anguilla]
MSLKKISISLDSFVQKQTLHISIERQFGSVQLNLLCLYSVGKLTLKTMLVCVWLVSSLIHMISGCSLYASTEVTGYTRGSVVLPCYCTEGQPTPNTARWSFSSGVSDITLWSYPNTVNDRFKDRVNISDTPGNLSLSLSDLTRSDGGTYSCEADGQHKNIRLTVKGCSLSASTEVTGYTRGSVVLPCYCTKGQPTPTSTRWVFSSRGSDIMLWSYPNTVNDRFKDRVIISDTPGNLSLSLSGLTRSDGGTYNCEADGQHRNIRLTVKEIDNGVTTQSPGITKHTSTRGSKPTSKTEISEDLKKSILYATIAAVVAAVAVCGAVLFYCRFRSRKNAHVESREEQEMRTGEQEEEKNADSVAYSTVVYSIKVEKYKHPKSK